MSPSKLICGYETATLLERFGSLADVEVAVAQSLALGRLVAPVTIRDSPAAGNVLVDDTIDGERDGQSLVAAGGAVRIILLFDRAP